MATINLADLKAFDTTEVKSFAGELSVLGQLKAPVNQSLVSKQGLAFDFTGEASEFVQGATKTKVASNSRLISSVTKTMYYRTSVGAYLFDYVDPQGNVLFNIADGATPEQLRLWNESNNAATVNQAITQGLTNLLYRSADFEIIHGLNPSTATASALGGAYIDQTPNAFATAAGAGVTPELLEAAALSVKGGARAVLVDDTQVGAVFNATKGSTDGNSYGRLTNLGGVPAIQGDTVLYNDDAVIFANPTGFDWGFAGKPVVRLAFDLNTNEVEILAEGYLAYTIYDLNKFAKVTLTPANP